MRRGRQAVLAAALIFGGWTSSGIAAEPRAFSIPAGPLSRALVDFAVQADVSIGADAARYCRPNSNAVIGRFSVEQGLTRLLAGTGCSFRMVDQATVRIVRASILPRLLPSPPPPPPPPAPPQALSVTPLEEVVVTSAKRSVGLDRAPFAVSAVEGAGLEESGAVDTGDLSSRIAGLTVTNLGPGRNKLIVRGLSDGALTGRTQATVGLYIDETRATYNAPDPDLRLVDIERVELLRGPQGSLYGAGSIGGVLQVITRQPDLSRRSGWISGEAALTAGGEPSGVIEGMLNLPIFTDRFGLRLVAYREKDGGGVDDVRLGLINVDQTVRQGMRANLRWDLNPRWSATMGLVAQTLHTDDTHYVDAALPSRRRALFVQEPHRNDFDEGHLTVHGDLGWAIFKLTSAVQTHEVETRYDATLALPDFSGPAGATGAFDEESHTDAVVTELTLASPTGGRIEWLAGLFSSEFDQATVSVLTSAASSLYAETRDDDIDEYAAYGEATWRPWSKLGVTFGARYFQLSVETASRVTEPGMTPADFTDKRTDHGFAPKLVVRYDLSDRALLYAQGAEGYRSGGFNTAGRIGQAAMPDRQFSGDELTNIEAGVRLRLRDGRLKVRAAVFRAGWENIQADELMPSGLPYTANIGNGRNRGLEVEAAYHAGPLRLEGSFLVNDPEIKEASPAFPSLKGRGLPGVPRLLLGGSARYEWGPEELRRFASAETSYVGSSNLVFGSGLSARMGDYWTSRVAAGVIADRWRLTGYVDNILNSGGDTFAYGNPFSLRFMNQETPQRPLTAGVIVTRAF